MWQAEADRDEVKVEPASQAKNDVSKAGKRGQYASYGPTLTAEISEFARCPENSVTATQQFFKSKYDIDLPGTRSTRSGHQLNSILLTFHNQGSV